LVWRYQGEVVYGQVAEVCCGSADSRSDGAGGRMRQQLEQFVLVGLRQLVEQ
jgi:hypothetical protein